VNGAGLAIDFGNTAELIRDITPMTGARDTVTTNYAYQVRGHDLIFTCAGPVDCISQPTGTITSTGDIDLDMGSGNVPIVYHFRRITVAY
jgi:formylmethanofuran dehydrogenase subunit A